jgi:hypothetical protein
MDTSGPPVRHPSERRRWYLDHGVVFSLATGLAAGCVPVLIAFPLRIDAGSAVMLAALAVLSVIADRNHIVLTRDVRGGVMIDHLRLSAGGVLLVVTVTVAGPLPAAAIQAALELSPRRPITTYDRLLNLSSYGWGALVATGMLALLGHPWNHLGDGAAVAAAVAAAVGAYYLTAYAIVRGVGSFLPGEQPVLASIRRELLPTLPAIALMAVVGALTATLTDAFGAIGLLPVAVAVLAPKCFSMIVARTSPPSSLLAPDVARKRYATALAVQLRLPARTRRVLVAASQRSEGEHWPRFTADGLRYEVGVARFYREEWYDGGGRLGLGGRLIPVESRVLAVATAWAELTAKGTAELSDQDAIRVLEREQISSRRFDPQVLAAARDVVDSAAG